MAFEPLTTATGMIVQVLTSTSAAWFLQAKVVAERCGDTVSFACLSQPFSGALLHQVLKRWVIMDSTLLNRINFKPQAEYIYRVVV